ncbi:tRNA pseudouridine(38-40) synthase TruA [Petrocella sp. FN5]|uniref:tRNA pseudouridine(38-40) synthase TruA n=1 Tax=Petrocella sp. FN5 TaxID=3032002 RepID=UPI0023D9BFC4|nr:tRNA pseudouridine(38-40) synthase TruA [Petrocella sp. FN5]MDF1616049.1 tRNA pseudouridine(38-40) synthase TruA [Petrocella sp. FN5]
MYYYKLTVAYDGTNYCGWQVQKNNVTVQGVMMKAAKSLFGEDVTLTGASRTDSGVHANGQVVLMASKKAMETYKIPLALNMHMPRDIVVTSAEVVDATFHPRYVPHQKTYVYHVYNGPHHLPRDQRYSMHYRYHLKLEPMLEAAKYFIGTHDFESYSSIKKSVDQTTRTIYDLKITREGLMYRFEIKGNGFLYNMVRIMVGTLLEVGNGRRKPDSIREGLEKKSRKAAGKTAPAKGLTLECIDYSQGD